MYPSGWMTHILKFMWFWLVNLTADIDPIELTFGGEGGIRTLGRVAPTPDFESGTFDHSATSPQCRKR